MNGGFHEQHLDEIDGIKIQLGLEVLKVI